MVRGAQSEEAGARRYRRRNLPYTPHLGVRFWHQQARPRRQIGDVANRVRHSGRSVAGAYRSRMRAGALREYRVQRDFHLGRITKPQPRQWCVRHLCRSRVCRPRLSPQMLQVVGDDAAAESGDRYGMARFGGGAGLHRTGVGNSRYAGRPGAARGPGQRGDRARSVDSVLHRAPLTAGATGFPRAATTAGPHPCHPSGRAQVNLQAPTQRSALKQR